MEIAERWLIQSNNYIIMGHNKNVNMTFTIGESVTVISNIWTRKIYLWCIFSVKSMQEVVVWLNDTDLEAWRGNGKKKGEHTVSKKKKIIYHGAKNQLASLGYTQDIFSKTRTKTTTTLTEVITVQIKPSDFRYVYLLNHLYI